MIWQTATLGQLCDDHGGFIQTGPFGSQLKQSEYVDDPDGVPVVMPKDIKDGRIDLESAARITEQKAQTLARHFLADGDIIFPRRGDINKLAIVEDATSVFCGTGCLRIHTPFEGVVPKYLYYFLGQKRVAEWLEGRAIGSTMLNLNTSIMRAVEVEYPAYEAQKRIAAILSAYDDLIENNRRRIGLLEDAARQLYKEWFVRLRFPGHEHTKVTDGVPEGWHITDLGNVVENFDRKRVPLSIMEREKRQGEYPYYGAAGILDYIDGYIFDGRYLLLGEDGTVQTKSGTPMLQLVDSKFWVSNHAHVLRGTDVSTEFLYCALSCYQISGHVTGVAQPKITQSNMNRIRLIVANDIIKSGFQDRVKPMLDMVFILSEKNQRLAKARDLLLPRLMNGSLTV